MTPLAPDRAKKNIPLSIAYVFIRKVGGDMGLGEARDLIEAADRQFDLTHPG